MPLVPITMRSGTISVPLSSVVTSFSLLALSLICISKSEKGVPDIVRESVVTDFAVMSVVESIAPCFFASSVLIPFAVNSAIAKETTDRKSGDESTLNSAKAYTDAETTRAKSAESAIEAKLFTAVDSDGTHSMEFEAKDDGLHIILAAI